MTKKMLVMFLSALLVCSLFTQGFAGKSINNGAMKRDTISCNRKKPGSCRHTIPANPYTRGCEAIKRCRGGISLHVLKGM